MNNETILDNLISRYPTLNTCIKDINYACDLLIKSYNNNNGKLLICGNGGSSSDADHIVGELMKSFSKKRPIDINFANNLKEVSKDKGLELASKLEKGLPAISLNAHSSLVSAVSNDIGGEYIFAQQVVGYGNKNDILLCITTSGNSQNIINAAITAKAKGLTIIGLTGETGGLLKQYCDITICVASDNTAEIQELHLPIYHTICQVLENHFFKSDL